MFDLVRRTPLEEYDGEGLFYVHAGTGMEVFHIRTSNGSYEGPKSGVNHEMVPAKPGFNDIHLPKPANQKAVSNPFELAVVVKDILLKV